eukprot:1078314_1
MSMCLLISMNPLISCLYHRIQYHLHPQYPSFHGVLLPYYPRPSPSSSGIFLCVLIFIPFSHDSCVFMMHCDSIILFLLLIQYGLYAFCIAYFVFLCTSY